MACDTVFGADYSWSDVSRSCVKESESCDDWGSFGAGCMETCAEGEKKIEVEVKRSNVCNVLNWHKGGEIIPMTR